MAAIELGIPYYIYSPSGTQYCALNAPTDSNFIGYVTDITGLDDAGVRENAQVVVAGDGGYHGQFWRDRRPWSMSGIIMPIFPLLARDQAQEKLEGVFGQAMALDGMMTWTPADGIQRMIKFRKQQPVRITKGQSNVEKTFQILGVTADYRIYSYTQYSVAATGAAGILTLPIAQNVGNADAPPKFVITGPYTSGNVTITNQTTGKSLVLDNPNISAGTTWTVDLTGTYPTAYDSAGNNHDGIVDPLLTDWTIAVAGVSTVNSGNNQFTISGAGTNSNSGLTVYWNHAWL